MNGFGFIEYEDAMDARDVVPGQYSPPVGPEPAACQASWPFLTSWRWLDQSFVGAHG